ncbi:hypothetical protein ACFS2C_19905 [Prauserella oleivorans]|uniref:Uncharacterized protein n=1 Tax=Prauserella oleivorans TaxID=1478153 RepID=A0ABW5WES7_9PSEU
MPAPRTSDVETVELAVNVPSPEQPRRTGRIWRGLTGSLAAGLVVLAIVVAVAQLVGWTTGADGPGMVALIGHLAGAAVAVAAQALVIDRRRGAPAGVAAAGILAVAAATLWLFWWA